MGPMYGAGERRLALLLSKLIRGLQRIFDSKISSYIVIHEV